jgi:hypothetical protein
MRRRRRTGGTAEFVRHRSAIDSESIAPLPPIYSALPFAAIGRTQPYWRWLRHAIGDSPEVAADFT